MSGSEYVGSSGAGVFNQSGGMHSVGSILYLGYSSSSSGTYSLSGSASLSVSGSEYVGGLYGGTGVFNQSGGTHNVGADLYLSYYSFGSTGTYSLSGSASLSVSGTEYVGSSGAGAFNQSGGINSTGFLQVAKSSSYLFSGGVLNITNGLHLDGTMNCAGGTTSINASTGSILDFGHGGTLSNTSQLSITGSANTLVIFPAGFNPAAQLAAYSNPGVTGFAGSDITIPVGTTIFGSATLMDHLIVQGTLTPRGGNILLYGGVEVAPGGSATASNLRVDDLTSGISGGSLSVSGPSVVGSFRTAAFNQSGGMHNVGLSLYVGYGSSGTYSLSGTGSLSVSGYEIVGYFGTGIFNQSGGTHSVGSSLYLGYNSGSSGTYTLSGGTFNARSVSVGNAGTGTFIWSGGQLNVSDLVIRNKSRVIHAHGTGGTLRPQALIIDSTSTLDLNDHDLVVNWPPYISTGMFTNLQALVSAGFRTSRDPTTTGIISTTSQNNGGTTILALFDNALVGVADWPPGSGQTVSANAVIGKYTYFGDLNLDGQVTGDDYAAIDANLGTTPPPGLAWLRGDANWDGQVTANDYAVIRTNLGLGAAAPLVPSSLPLPESGAMSLLPLTSGALLRRRRR